MLYIGTSDDNTCVTIASKSQAEFANDAVGAQPCGFAYYITVHESGDGIAQLADLRRLLIDANIPYTIEHE